LPNFRIDTASTGSGLTMKLAGELDSAVCRELIERFESVLAEGATVVILDLDEVTFMDSAGLRAIIVIERTSREREVALTIHSPAGPVSDLIQMTGIDEHVALAPRADEPPPSAPFIERVDLELASEPTAPGRARAELREALAERLDDTDLATLTLLASELVTNAVVHPGAHSGETVGLRITSYPDRVRVEVTDAGTGFDIENLQPRPRDYGGHGLVVVESLSSRWGTTRTGEDGGFCVWFELDLAEPGAAADSLEASAPREAAESSVAAEG
jgi:anti-anti-sigma factor